MKIEMKVWPNTPGAWMGRPPGDGEPQKFKVRTWRNLNDGAKVIEVFPFDDIMAPSVDPREFGGWMFWKVSNSASRGR